MPRRSRSQPDPLATFPEWARRLAERYYTKTVSTFILHGAVRDLQPADDGKGGRRFVALRTFLSDELFGSRDLGAFYDRSSGIRLATPEMQKDFMAAVAGYDSLFGTEYAKAVPKDPARAFPLLLPSAMRTRAGSRSPRRWRRPEIWASCPARIATPWSPWSSGRRTRSSSPPISPSAWWP